MNSIQLVINHEVHEVKVKEYQGQRVVTFRDIDVIHRKNTGAARKSFNAHKDQFVEGEDYFVLNMDEASQLFGLRAPNGVVVATESGYLLLVKPFTDELAWTVQRQLIKTYFKAKELFTPKSAEVVQAIPQAPTTIEDILSLAFSGLSEMNKKIHNLEQDNRKLSLVVDNEIHLTDIQCAGIQEAVKERVVQLKKLGYDKHYHSIFSALKVFFTVPKYNKIRRGDFEQAIDFIKGWYPKKKEEQQA